MSTTLSEHIAQIPYKSLWGMATRLDLRHRGQQQKADWKAQFAAGWKNTQQATVWLSALSPTATAGLQRFWQAEQIPAILFWADMGQCGRRQRNKRGPRRLAKRRPTSAKNAIIAVALPSRQPRLGSHRLGHTPHVPASAGAEAGTWGRGKWAGELQAQGVLTPKGWA